MLIDVFRFIRGYVSFDIDGRYPERFINITSRNGIRVWNVKRRGEGFSACMYISDYLRIRPFAHKAKVRLKVTEKRGLPSFLYRYKDRAGVAIGACVFTLTVFIMSLFIWSIDITGLETVSISEMQSLLRDQGMYIGAFKPSLDFQGISRSIMLKKHDIGWMAVNVTGSYVSVEVKEEAPAPDVADIYSPCNVKAKRDGRILSIDTLEGAAGITEGSGVTAGQLLVSGVMSDEQGGLRLVHADARVMAQTRRSAEFTISDSFTSLIPSGEYAERRGIRLPWLSLPYQFASVSSPYSVCDKLSSSPAPLGVALPVEAESETVYALEPTDNLLDDSSAKELLIAQSELYEFFALNECTVTARSYSLSHNGGEYTLEAVYTCVEDIAYSDPIGTDENTDLTYKPTEPESR